MMTDPIADLLTRIRNGILAKKDRVWVPASRIKANIVRVLKEEGYVENFRLVRDEKRQLKIRVHLRYLSESSFQKKVNVIRGVKRVSRPGLRIYAGYQNIPKTTHGAGMMILSTPKGLMTARTAIEKKMGGEILCEVW